MRLVTRKTKYLEGWNFQPYPRTSGRVREEKGLQKKLYKLVSNKIRCAFRFVNRLGALRESLT